MEDAGFFCLFSYLYFLSPFTVITTPETVVSKRGGIVMFDYVGANGESVSIPK